MNMVRLIENGGYEATTSQKRAREIMGKNFFGIEEAIKHFGVNPSKKETATLAEVPFTEGVLESHKDTHILVAVFPMSILDVRKMDNLFFYSSSDGWYKSEKFAKNKGAVSWQLVRKIPAEDSTSKNWDEQQALLSKDDETPSVQIMAYTIIGHYKTGERLFENVYVRTLLAWTRAVAASASATSAPVGCASTAGGVATAAPTLVCPPLGS